MEVDVSIAVPGEGLWWVSKMWRPTKSAENDTARGGTGVLVECTLGGPIPDRGNRSQFAQRLAGSWSRQLTNA